MGMVEISPSMNCAWKSALFHEQLNSNSFAHRYATGSILRIYFAQSIRDGCVLAPCKAGFFVGSWVSGSLGRSFVLSLTTKARLKRHQMATWQRPKWACKTVNIDNINKTQKQTKKKGDKGILNGRPNKHACTPWGWTDRRIRMHVCEYVCEKCGVFALKHWHRRVLSLLWDQRERCGLSAHSHNKKKQGYFPLVQRCP